MNYHERLAGLVADRGHLCVGVDPHRSIVEAWGHSYDVTGIEKVSRDLIAAVGERVPAYKPQSAFFECFGPAGVEALARVMADIRETGAVCILDVKRGDIGSTMAAYARAYLSGDTSLTADAITVSPFLGFGALSPALELARETGRGIYVLCRTSNPEGQSVQGAVTEGSTVSQQIVDAASAVNTESDNLVGLVIGATHEQLGVDLSGFAGSILAPGVGAQGGTMEGAKRLFGDARAQVLASVARGVLTAGPNPDTIHRRIESLQR